jgi:hypothetical protein
LIYSDRGDSRHNFFIYAHKDSVNSVADIQDHEKSSDSGRYFITNVCNTEIEDRIVNERECRAVEKRLGRKLNANVDVLGEYGLLWESEDVDLMDRDFRFLRNHVKVWDLVPLYAHLSVADEWDRMLGCHKDGIAKVIGFKDGDERNWKSYFAGRGMMKECHQK